jgi:hypothetical protein
MVARATPGITHSPALAPWPDCCTPPTGGASRQSPGCLAGRKHRGLRGHVDMPHGRCGPLLSHWLRPTWQAGGQAASKLFTADPPIPLLPISPPIRRKKAAAAAGSAAGLPKEGAQYMLHHWHQEKWYNCSDQKRACSNAAAGRSYYHM